MAKPKTEFASEVAALNTMLPGTEFVEITPATTNLSRKIRGIYVGVTGDVKITDWHDGVTTFVGLMAGVIHPICAKRVWSVGTDATDIVGAL